MFKTHEIAMGPIFRVVIGALALIDILLVLPASRERILVCGSRRVDQVIHRCYSLVYFFRGYFNLTKRHSWTHFSPVP